MAGRLSKADIAPTGRGSAKRSKNGFCREYSVPWLPTLLFLAILPACAILPQNVRQELEPAPVGQKNNFRLSESASSEAVPIQTAANAACSGSPPFPKGELRDGQIILTESGGPVSALMALVPSKFYPFSHSAIVAIEDGEPVVYEARGTFKQGGGTPAEDWFEKGSGIQRLPLAEYLAREEYAVVYDPPPGVDRQAVAAFARAEYQAGTAFDPFFDHTSTDRLHCTEFVDAALRAGGRPDARFVRTRTNPSLQAVLKWWGTNVGVILPAGHLRDGGEYRGELGDTEARRAALVFNAAKRQLHARFTPDQKIGNVFKYEGGLRYRTSVRAFPEQAQASFEDTCPDVPMQQVDGGVARLAARLFKTPRKF